MRRGPWRLAGDGRLTGQTRRRGRHGCKHGCIALHPRNDALRAALHGFLMTDDGHLAAHLDAEGVPDHAILGTRCSALLLCQVAAANGSLARHRRLVVVDGGLRRQTAAAPERSRVLREIDLPGQYQVTPQIRVSDVDCFARGTNTSHRTRLHLSARPKGDVVSDVALCVLGCNTRV